MILASPRTFRVYGRTIEIFHLKTNEGVPLHEHEYQHAIFISSGRVRVLGIDRLYDGDVDQTKLIFQPSDQHGFVAESDAVVVSIFVTREAPHDSEWLTWPQ